MAGLHKVTVGADCIVGYFRGGNFANFTNRKQFVKILPLKCSLFPYDS